MAKAKWKVVVTGASSKLAQSLLPLLADKYQLVLLVRDKKKAKLPKGRIIQVDLERASVEELRKIVAGADAVVNLAGLVDFTAPREKLFAVNAEATCKMVKACEEEGVKNFLHCSSIAVYGLPPANASENVPLKPFTDYGRSKLAGEQCVTASKLNWVSLRPAIIYGPNFVSEIELLIKLLKKNQAAILGKGNNHLPLVHQIDAAKAFALALAALQRGDKKVARQCFTIVAQPQPTQLRCYEAVEKIFGFSVPRRHVSPRVAQLLLKGYELIGKLTGKNRKPLSWNVLMLLALDRSYNCGKAAKLLKWKAEIGIQEGLCTLKKQLAGGATLH